MAEVMDRIVDFITTTNFDDLPKETVDYTKLLCLSQLAAVVGGAGLPASQILGRHVQAQGGVAEAGVVGWKFKAPALQAALYNATAAHATELEDDNMGGGSTIGTIIPAVFTLAEARKSTGKEILESIVVGYDMQVKTANASKAIRRGIMFFCTGAWGPAASAAKLMKLDTHRTNMTLSIVTSLLGGFDSQTPSMTHFFESGMGAHNGLLAAMLAEGGFTGQRDIVEGAPSMHFPGMWEGMGFDPAGLVEFSESLTSEILLMRVGIKKYGSINITQRLIDAAIAMRREHGFTYEDVASVEVHIAPWFASFSKYPHPQAPDEARFSIEHLIASVLLYGSVTLKTFTEEAIRDPALREARVKIQSIVHPERGHLLYTNGPDELVIKLKNGMEYRKQSEVTGAGHASTEEVVEKFKSAAEFSGYMSSAAVDRVTELVLDLDRLDDVGEVMDILTYGRLC